MNRMFPKSLLFALALGVGAFALPVPAGAETKFIFVDGGVEIDNGSEAPFILEFPVIMGTDKKNKITGKEVISDTETKITYNDGSKVTVTLAPADGQITWTVSDQPELAEFLTATMAIKPEVAIGGTWKMGDKEGPFPEEAPTAPMVAQASSTTFQMVSGSNVPTSVVLPSGSFQQLQDGRVWNLQRFMWLVFAPIRSVDIVTIQFVEGGADSSAPSSSAAPAADDQSAVSAPAAPATPTAAAPLPEVALGETKVLKWADGKKAAYYVAFDDSTPSHLTNVIPELIKRGIVGVFYINPGGALYKGKQDEWAAAAKLPGIEMANHTYTHKGSPDLDHFRDEIVKTNEVIKALYPDRPWPRLISFGKPGGVKWGITDEDIKTVLKEQNLVNRPWFDGPPLTYKTDAEMLAKVDKAIKAGELGHVDFHGVGGDWHIASLFTFHTLLDKLEQEAAVLWVTDPVSAHQYAVERKTAKVETLESRPDQIRLRLTCEADSQFYNHPLSLVTGVPTHWTVAKITQGAASQSVEVQGSRLMYKALPGADEIILSAN